MLRSSQPHRGNTLSDPTNLVSTLLSSFASPSHRENHKSPHSDDSDFDREDDDDTHTIIDTLKTYNWSGLKSECGICLKDVIEKQVVKEMPCLHYFHTRCVEKWLETKMTCPNCRAEVVGK